MERGWVHCTSVNEAVTLLMYNKAENIEEIALATNLGKNSQYGGDGSALLLWMVENVYWPETMTLRGKTDEFDRLIPVIKKYGNYPKKSSPYSWTRK